MISIRWPIAILTGALGGWMVARSGGYGETPTPQSEPQSAGLVAQLRQSAQARDGTRSGAKSDGAAVAQRVDRDLATAQELTARISQATADELPGLFKELSRFPYRTLVRDLAEAALWQRCIETGPLEAVEWIRRDTGGYVVSFSAAWLRHDKEAAGKWLRDAKLSESDMSFILHYCNLNASPDFQTELLMDAFQPDSIFSGVLLNYSLQVLANRDPAAAQRLFASLPPDHPLRGDVAKLISQTLARTDFEAARAWAMELPAGLREDALYSAMAQAVYRDPDRIRQELESTTLPEGRLCMLRGSLIGALSDRDPLAALEYLRSLPDAAAREARCSFSVPDVPLATLHALWGEWQRAGLDFTLNWKGRDAVADLRAFSVLPDGHEKFSVLLSLLESQQIWEKISPEDISGLPDGASAQLARKGFNVALRNGDVEAARGWAAVMADPSDVDFIDVARQAAAASDPAMSQLGKELLSNLSPDGRATLGFLQSRAVLEQEGPQAARDYVFALPESDRPLAFTILMSIGLSEDETAVMQWQQDIPSGPLQDSYASGLARHYALTDPTAALRWVRSIEDPEARQREVSQFAELLLGDDFTTGSQVLDQAGLSADELTVVEEVKRSVKP